WLPHKAIVQIVQSRPTLPIAPKLWTVPTAPTLWTAQTPLIIATSQARVGRHRPIHQAAAPSDRIWEGTAGEIGDHRGAAAMVGALACSTAASLRRRRTGCVTPAGGMRRTTWWSSVAAPIPCLLTASVPNSA